MWGCPCFCCFPVIYTEEGGGGGTNKWRFLAASWIKICIPMYLWLAVIVYMYCLDKDFSVLKSIPVFLLNLQGSNWVADFVNVPVISDMGILWFFTVIMLCYAMHPVERTAH